MSSFWSWWIVVLLVANLAVACFLFVWAQRVDVPTQPDGTTGHVWAHGVLREAVRTLPTWWVVVSAGLFVWGIVFLVMFPALGARPGLLGWTSTGQFERDRAANAARLETTFAGLRKVSIEQLASNEDALELGRVVFEDNCAACHGRDARGNTVVGAPNLIDGNSLYGNEPDQILTSILDGRKGVMPALDAVVGQQGANEVVAYVLTLNGYQAPADWVAAGKTRFETVCVACHGPDGRGNHDIGAPDLTDDVWLYGRDFTRMTETVRQGRNGFMPAWRERLGEDRCRAVAAWVYAEGQREIGVAR
jgi:cytochrome c oxidase cbb3-type subunit 3